MMRISDYVTTVDDYKRAAEDYRRAAEHHAGRGNFKAAVTYTNLYSLYAPASDEPVSSVEVDVDSGWDNGTV